MLKYFVERMKLFSYEAGTDVFRQGYPGSKFYIVSEGTLAVRINGQRCTVLSKGDSFGELALIDDSCRSATINCATDAYLWVLDR